MIGPGRGRADIESNLYRGVDDNGFAIVLDEFKLKVDPNDRSVAQHLITDGYWESWITSWMSLTVQPHWDCLDIGANFGYYTGVLTTLAPNGTVVAFEPNPVIASMLEESKTLNNWDRVEIVHAAIGAGELTMTLTMNSDLQGSGSLLMGKDYFSKWGEDFTTYEVPVKALDSYGLSPHFIKMDVEGFEPHVFVGGSETISKAEVILIEITPDHPTEFLDHLFNYYKVTSVNHHGWEERVERSAIATSDWWMLVLRKKD